MSLQPSSLPTLLQKQIQEPLFGLALDQTSTKLGKNGMIKANVAEFQAEGILPRQSISYSISGLAVCQAFHKLKDGFFQNSGHGQKMDESIPHFPSKKAPLGVSFPHAPLVLRGAFPTFWEDFPLCPEF
jgi:hypothetical protein